MSYNAEVYTIIKNEGELQSYVDSLPDLGEGFKYYICLFARKKYGGTEGLKSDKGQLKRVVASKGLIIKKLRQMEIPLGRYDINGLEINQESLVVYISANPRDLHRASLEMASAITLRVARNQPYKSPHTEAFNIIQTTGKKLFLNLDLDFKEGCEISPDTIKIWLRGKVNEQAYRLIRTRGGYHLIIEYSRIDKSYVKSYYLRLQDTEGLPMSVDFSNGDGFTPIPGCVQGDFVPKVV